MKKGQKHQNKTAFKIQFDEHAINLQKRVSLQHLCSRCCKQITWKMTYNKYKKMTEPAVCALCQKKEVYRSYMRACEPCTVEHKLCPKCLDTDFQKAEEELTKEQQRKRNVVEEKKMNEYVKTLRERSRRTIKRGLDKGTIFWSPEKSCFIDAEDQPLVGLKFRYAIGDQAVSSVDEEDEDLGEENEDEEIMEDGEERQSQHQSQHKDSCQVSKEDL